MRDVKLVLIAALIAGIGFAFAVVGVGLLLSLFSGGSQALRTFGVVGVVGIPLWVILIAAMGIPLHLSLKHYGLTEYRHYANASVVSVFVVIASILAIAYTDRLIHGKVGFTEGQLIAFLFFAGFLSLLLGIPIGLLFRRLVASTIPPSMSED